MASQDIADRELPPAVKVAPPGEDEVSLFRVLLTVGLGTLIFVIDTISPLGIAVAVLYAIVIMMAMDLCSRRGLILVGVACAALTVVSYLIGHGGAFMEGPLLRCLVSLSAIAITTILALRNQRATAILSQSEKRYRNIFQATGVAIWEEDFSQVRAALNGLANQGVTDIRSYLAQHPDFLQDCISQVRIVDMNDAAVRLLGAEDKAEVMASLRSFFLPETISSFTELLCALFEGRESCEYETAIRTVSGERRSILMAATIPADLHSNLLVSVLDITERNRTALALQQAQAALAHVSRVSTLGELTASIAHEVNQPLAAIVTSGEAALRWLARQPPELDEARACLERTIGEGRRAGAVVQRLRALSSRSDLQLVDLDLNDLIQDTARLMRREALEQGVVVHLDLASALPRVRADRVQLQQVLINLIVNAIHAMADGLGRPKELLLTSRPYRDGVQISVRDSGTGLPADTAERLFDAFFTTKQDGMGMGLSICRTIVEACHGRIWAENNADSGATFHFTIPASAES